MKNSEVSLIYAPSARGSVVWKEVESLRNQQYRVQIWRAPYLSHPFPESLSANKKLYQLCCDDLKKKVDDLRAGGQKMVFGIGLNLGGGVISYVNRSRIFDGLVVAGAILDLSDFWMTSGHTTAQTFRSNCNIAHSEFLEVMGQFDLSKSILSSEKSENYYQVGTNDHWLDPEQLAKYRILANYYNIDVIDESHGMDRPESIRKRIQWINSEVSRRASELPREPEASPL